MEDKLKILETLDERVEVELRLAVAKIEAYLGPIDFTLKIEDRLHEGALACCNIKTNEVTLSGEYFANTEKEILDGIVEQTRKNQFHPYSKLRTGSVLIHELSHAVWNMIVWTGVDLKKEVAPIAKKWDEWMTQNKKQACLSYAATNLDEFWAEMLTEAVDGSKAECPDMEFAKQILALALKYKPNQDI